MFLLNLRKMLNHRMTVLSITAVLAIIVAWQAGSLVWKLWVLSDESPRPESLIPLSVGNTAPESLQNLIRYPLIRSASIPATQGSSFIDAPETSLNLKLVGVMYSEDKNEARAIIENPEDGARSFAVRERVADNAEIYSIEPDRVILLHAGREEALMLYPDQESSGNRAGTGSQTINNSNKNRAGAVTPPALANASRSIDDLMGDFSATPVMEKGVLLGFRLKALRKPEILEEWGIGPDDVITAVNGIPLNTPGRVMILYDKLKKQREFEITLNSGGNNRTVAVDLTE